MELRSLAMTLDALDEMAEQALCVFMFEDVRPVQGMLGLLDWRLSGLLSKRMLSGELSGALEECVLLGCQPDVGPSKVIIFGLGAKANFSEERFSAACEAALDALKSLCVNAAAFMLPGRAESCIEAARARSLFLELNQDRPTIEHVALIEASG